MRCRHRNLWFGLIVGAFAPTGLFAQGLDIQPIGIELAADSEQLVLAGLPLTGAAPSFGGNFNDSPMVVRAAIRQSGTLPKPSIILGLIAPGAEEDFGLDRLLPSTVEEISFALDDLAAREALRAKDAELFRRLVEEGHIDPDTGDLKRVLQTELSRMNCYRSGIDGAWGPGSRRSVNEYFDQLTSVEWDDPQPTNSLFRSIIINGDVKCITPVAAAPRATTSKRTTTKRKRTTAAKPKAAAPRKAAAPAAKKPKMTIGGQGVFR